MAEWQLSLKRHPKGSGGEPSFELTLRGDDLGELLGEALRAAILTADGDSPSPVYLLTQLVSQLLNNAVTWQDGALGVLQQILLHHEHDERISEMVDDREMMEAALRRALGMRD